MSELAENHTLSRLRKLSDGLEQRESVTKKGIVTETNAVDVPVASAMVALGIPSPPTRIDPWHDASDLNEEGERA